MLKNLLLVCTLAVVSAGCGDEKTTNGDMGGTNPDLSTAGNTDMPGSNPDMAPSCFTNPMVTEEFLNSCHTAAIDQVDIVPFYPTLAPGGVLPALP